MYGGGAYWNTAHPTRDNVIPWKAFILMYGRLSPIWALEAVTMTQAVSQAIAITMGEKNNPGNEAYRKLVAEAFPEHKEM